MDHNDRRVLPALVGVTQLDTPAAHQWRLVFHDRLFQDIGQIGSFQITGGRTIGGIHCFHEVSDTCAMQCGNEQHLGKRQERQLALEFGLDAITLVTLQAIPLVDDHHQRPAALHHMTGKRCILFGDALMGIEHQQHYIGLFHGLQGLDDAELLYGFGDAGTAPHTRRVHQGVLSALMLERHLNAVAGGAGLVEGHQAFLAEQTVDQRGFTDIWATHNGDLYAPLFGLGIIFFFRGKIGKHPVDQGLDTPPVCGGNGHGFAQSQGMKFSCSHIPVQRFGLVRHHGDGLARLAQFGGNLLVCSGQPLAGIDQVENMVGLFDSQAYLPVHEHFHTFPLAADAARVHHHIRTVADTADTVLTVTGKTRLVRNQGIPAAGQAIEQSGLAHIGTANQRDNGKHDLFRQSQRCEFAIAGQHIQDIIHHQRRRHDGITHALAGGHGAIFR